MADLDLRFVLRAIDRVTGPMRQVNAALGRVVKNSTLSRDAMRKAFSLGADIRQTATAVDSFAAKTRQVLQAPIDEFEKFDHEITRAGALAGATGNDLLALRNNAKELGSTIGEFSALDAAKAMSEYGMAGYDTTQILAALPSTLDLSTAATVELGETVAITTGIMGGFGLRADEIGRVGDVLSAAFTGSKTSLASLGETMSYAGAVARDAGVSLEETAVIAGLLGNASIDGTRAGTALNAILKRLAAPKRMGKKALDFLQISPDDNGALKTPLRLLGEIKKAVEPLTDVKRLTVLDRIFGQEAAPAVATLIQSLGTDTIERLTTRVYESEGALQGLAATMRGTSRNAALELQSAINGAQISFGEAFAPTLDAARAIARDFFVEITALTSRFPRLTTALMITVGVVAALTTALAAILFTVATLAGTAGFIALAFGVELTAAQLAKMTATAIPRAVMWLGRLAATIVTRVLPAMARLALAVVLNPIGLIVVAIVAAVAAVVWLVQNWDSLTAAWERFKNASIGAKIAVAALLAPVAILLSPLLGLAYAGKLVAENWDSIKSTLVDVWTAVTTAVEDALAAIVRLGDNPVVQALMTAGAAAVNPFAGLATAGANASGAIGDVLSPVADLGRRIAGGAADIATEAAGVLGFGGGANSQVNGTIRLQVETPEGTTARVRGLDASGPVDLQVDTGVAMSGAY